MTRCSAIRLACLFWAVAAPGGTRLQAQATIGVSLVVQPSLEVSLGRYGAGATAPPISSRA